VGFLVGAYLPIYHKKQGNEVKSVHEVDDALLADES